MKGKILKLKRRENTKEKGCLNRLASIVLAAAIPTALCGVYTPSTNLTRHLEEPIVDPFAPKIHNNDYLSGPYTPFFLKYKDEIIDAASRYDIPPEMIAGIIVKENYGRYQFEDWKDTAALLWNTTFGQVTDTYADPSLGAGQINVQTAHSLSRMYNQQKSTEYIQDELKNPEKNIEYIAMMLSELMNRENRIPRSTSLFDDPELVAIIATEYVTGPTPPPLEDAEPNREGVYFVQYLGRIPCIRIFADATTITKQQQTILREYAEQHIKEDSLQATTVDAYKALLPPPLFSI